MHAHAAVYAMKKYRSFYDANANDIKIDRVCSIPLCTPVALPVSVMYSAECSLKSF